MTREEAEIRNAIDTTFPIFNTEKGRTYEQALMATGFEAGIKWADNNPKSPWISVEDDLPCNNPNNIHFGFTNNVLATDGENIFTMYMKRCDVNKWIWCVDNVDLSHSITHWMPIPKPPKQ